MGWELFSASAVQRVSDAAYVNACRFSYLIAPDPDDPDRKRMAPLKANILPGQSGLAYRLQSLAPEEARAIFVRLRRF